MKNSLLTTQQALSFCNQQFETALLVEVFSEYYRQHEAIIHSKAKNTKTRQVNIDCFERVNDWRLKPEEDINVLLFELGLTAYRNKPILIFDNIVSKCGSKTSRFDASARLFCLLKMCGFTQLHIVHDVSFSPDAIDAKIVKTEQQNLQLKQESHTNSRTHLKSTAPSPYIQHTQLERYIKGAAGDYRLFDARSTEEYSGKTTGYPYIRTPGKIPTAEHLSSCEFQAQKDETLQTLLARLECALADRGVQKTDIIIWYCGTSWRASRMHALAYSLGYKNSYVYDGGWFEWQNKHTTSEALGAITA